MGGTGIGGQSLLQLPHFRPQHELAMRQHRFEARTQGRLDAPLLRLEVQKGDRLGHDVSFSMVGGVSAGASPANSGTNA